MELKRLVIILYAIIIYLDIIILFKKINKTKIEKLDDFKKIAKFVLIIFCYFYLFFFVIIRFILYIF